MEKFPKPEKAERAEKFSSHLKISKTPEGEVLELVEGNKKINFKNFVPDGVEFITEDFLNFAYDPENRVLTIDEAKLNSLKGRLSLLHEMGHAIDFDKNKGDSAEWIAQRELFEKINAIKIAILFSKNYSQSLTREAREAYFIKTFAEGVKTLKIPEPDLEKFIKMLAKEERTAWAEALKLYRRIKQETEIDLLGGTQFKEMSQLLEDPLENYEKILGQLLPNQQAKLFLAKKFNKE